MEVAVWLGQFDIHAGLDGKSTRLLLVLCDEVSVRLGTISQFPDGVVIGDGKSLEAPFFSKYIAHEPDVCVGRNAVNLVVRRHDADGAASLDRFLKGKQERLAQNPH